MAGERRRRRRRKKSKHGDAEWDLSKPARNTAGEWQIEKRSSEADRDRLAAVPITVWDYEGIAGHVAGQTLPRMILKRRGEASEARNDGIPPPGRGAPMELLEEHSRYLAEVERRVDRQRERGPRLVSHPRNTQGFAVNLMAHMTPLDRLTFLRRSGVRKWLGLPPRSPANPHRDEGLSPTDSERLVA